jgi:hypothetical protein
VVCKKISCQHTSVWGCWRPPVLQCFWRTNLYAMEKIL